MTQFRHGVSLTAVSSMVSWNAVIIIVRLVSILS